MNSKLAAFLLAGSFAVSAVVSCDSGGGGGGGSGGDNEGGSSTGGKGGTSTGGKGGTSTGGKGGTSTGGKGGTSTGGSSSGGTSAGGAGGAAKGGAGGSAQGGAAQGGSAQGGSAGASAGLPGDFFFKGEDNTVTKLVAGDAMPGYLYLSDNAGAASTIDYAAVTNATFPAGTDTAIHFDLPTVAFSNIILGFNFRVNAADNTWQWADMSKYKGIQFWARARATAAINLYIYDWNMFPETPPAGETKGKCPGSVRDATCEPVYGTLKVIRTTWEQFTIPFTEFTTLNPVKGLDLAGVGRIDFLYSAPNAAGLELWMTGIKMVTEVPL